MVKTYKFTGKHKKNNKYEKFYTNERFIKTKVVKKLKQLQKQNKLPNNIEYIDTSAGNGMLSNILKQEKIISKYKSYDISPAKAKYGNITKKNWLKTKEKMGGNVLLGFNPPYGYNNRKAKMFVKHGWELKAKYVIWLVPKSMERFLEQHYRKISKSTHHSIQFINKTVKRKVSKINQSVILFIGERLDSVKILSRRQTKKEYDYNISRTHYKGIDKSVTLIVKKTGNPVLNPIFWKRGKYWYQYSKGKLITKKALMVKRKKHYFIKGISETKLKRQTFYYAIESNIYFKISGLEKYLSIKPFIFDLMKLSETKKFYDMVNVYKPAAIIKKWFLDYINKLIKHN
tara:strand:+ start:149 stop:1180 length:1032 start_codon:yes stop_codon:yes gene_type:complete